jgi:hypothetical protein
LAVIEAELLILMMAFLNPVARWYPQTLHYSSHHREFLFFVRATQHKHFLKLAEITGISDANALREAVKEGHKRLDLSRNNFPNDSFWASMNMDKLDSIT